MIAENILYEDKRLLVLNKPSGFAVHGGSGLSYGISARPVSQRSLSGIGAPSGQGYLRLFADCQKAQHAGKSLKVISISVERINDMSSQIASAAEEQHAVTEEINQNIVSISNMAAQTSEGASQTSLSSEELARLATELQTIVQQFKV